MSFESIDFVECTTCWWSDGRNSTKSDVCS